MIPLNRVLGGPGPARWWTWTSEPVELGQDLDPFAESACSVGMFARWRADVTSRV
jgi:hypothetical protein